MYLRKTAIMDNVVDENETFGKFYGYYKQKIIKKL